MTPSLHQSSKIHLIRTYDLSIATSDSMIHPRATSLLPFHQPLQTHLDAFHFFPLLPPAAASFFAKATHHISQILLFYFNSQRIAKIAADLSRFTAPHKHTFGLFLAHYSRLLLFRPRKFGTRLLKTPWAISLLFLFPSWEGGIWRAKRMVSDCSVSGGS